jgi:hypothetical protein
MASAVKLSDEIVELARSEGKLMKRSIAGQVEYWATLGRRLETSGILDFERVHAVLAGQGSVESLSPEEDALYLDLLTDELEALDGSDTQVIRALEAGGHPIAGENAEGELVIEPPSLAGRKLA